MTCTSLQIGYRGERLKMLIQQGSTFGPYLFTMSNPDGSRVNLTGKTIRGQIRQNPLDTIAAATLTVTKTSDTQGEWEFVISATVTAAMTCGNDITKDASKYCHNIEMDNGDGTVTPLYFGDRGDVLVAAECTRP